MKRKLNILNAIAGIIAVIMITGAVVYEPTIPKALEASDEIHPWDFKEENHIYIILKHEDNRL